MNQMANVVIDRLGGTTATAKICECKPPSVHEWRLNGIPKSRLQFLRLAHPEAFEGIDQPDQPDQPDSAPVQP
jgi:hypothetical protein